MDKIVIIGAGSFGTALAQQLSSNIKNELVLLARDERIVTDINNHNRNEKYFPGRQLNKNITATADVSVLQHADVVFIALPSSGIPTVISVLKSQLQSSAILVNTAKGIFDDGKTIFTHLENELPNGNIAVLKGASFSVEMMNQSPTMMTFGYKNFDHLNIIDRIVQNTNIFVDYTTDITGVEWLSSLKNVYAILVGHVDASYNAANTRFMVLSKAIQEIKLILTYLGGKAETMFLGCGIGDISLTALNDLSRNRTLGLLIGKGFLNNISERNNSVVLEGIKTLKLLDTAIDPHLRKKLPLLNELVKLLVVRDDKRISLDFNKILKRNFTTVLTYGTFDLIHYGHLELLRRAKSLGDHLIVGLSTDEFNEKKGKICEMPFEKRKLYLESIQYVDMVISENSWEQKVTDIKKYHVDTFVMGDDWSGKFDFLKEYCEVKYLPRTEGVSTTELKSILRANGH